MSRFSPFPFALFPLLFWSTLVLCTPVRDDGSGMFPRQTPATSADPMDQSWIRNFASIGDSYSSGIGAGTRLNGLGDYFCSRYDKAFPSQIWADNRLGSGKGQTFTNWACSGAEIPAIITQANALADGSQDVITITAGGNDAYLSDILNQCIYMWLGKSSPTYDACPPELIKAQDVINSDTFKNNLDKLLSTAKSKLSPSGTIYYVGYTRFFGDTDAQCNDITWSFWYNWGKRHYLTQSMRQQMNQLVLNMNNALQQAVSRAGNNVVFVNPDQYFEMTVGRYCEDGYPETNGNREGLILYEWDTYDTTEPGTVVPLSQPLPRSGELVMKGTFEGQINDWVRQALHSRPNLTVAHPQTSVGSSLPIDEIKATKDQLVTGYSSSLIPDSYGHIFHPRPGGHTLIASLVLYYMEVTRGKKLGVSVPSPVQSTGTCPARKLHNATPTPTPTPSSMHTPLILPRKKWNGI